MKLLLINYKKTKQLIVLKLGDRSNKLCCVVSSSLTDTERLIIKSAILALNKASLNDKIDFIRKYCPNSYKNGYKEILLSNIEIIEEYSF